MTLATARAASAHTPLARVYLDGVLLSEPIVSLWVERDFEDPIARAEVVFAEAISAVSIGWRRQELAIDLGWQAEGDGPWYKRVFTGVIQQRTRDAASFANTLAAESRLALVQDGLDLDTAFEDQTGAEIIADILDACGISSYNLDDEPGGANTFASLYPIVMKAGESPMSFIDRLDEPFTMATFDDRDGYPRRRRVYGQPSGSARATRSKASPDFFTLTRREDVSAIYNKVLVTGPTREDGSSVDGAAANTTALVVRDQPYILPTDILQTGGECDAAALAIIEKVSHVQEEVAYEVVGDPEAGLGDTDALLWSDLDLTANELNRYFVKRFRHDYSPRGFYTSMTAIGGVGSGSSFEISTHPNAAFTLDWNIDEDADEVTICARDESTDPDGIIAARAWSNDASGDTGSGTTYCFTLTLSTAPDTVCVSLLVTDNDGLTDAVTHCLDLSAYNGGLDGTPPPGGTTGGGTGGGSVPVTGLTIVSAPGRGIVQSAVYNGAALGVIGNGGITPPSGSAWVGAQDIAAAGLTFILTDSFTLSSGLISSAVLQYAFDDVAWVDVNGVRFGTSLADPANSATLGWNIAGLLHPGTNTLVFEVVNTVDASGWGVAYRLDVA